MGQENMLIYLRLYIIQKIPLFVFLIMAVISILFIISRGNFSGRSVWPIPSLITYCTCRAILISFVAVSVKANQKLLWRIRRCGWSFPFCLLIRRPIILHGEPLCWIPLEKSAPLTFVCLITFIAIVFFSWLLMDWNLTLFCVRANMRRLWKM